MKLAPVSVLVLMTLTCALIAVQIVLICLICKNFGKQLKKEIYYLCAVQFFFQLGFAFRVWLDQRQLSLIKSYP